jgi:quinol monooxygenase YgiN
VLTVIATLKVQPGKEDAFVAAAKSMIEYVTANEPGTKLYSLHRSMADPTTFVFYEVYADQAAFAAHGGSPAMAEFFGAAGTLLAGRPDIAMYEDIAARG